MMKDECKCNCHSYVLHEPKCDKNKARTMTQAKRTKCTCNPVKPKNPESAICTGCYENHKENPSYDSVKWMNARLGALFD